MISAVLCIAIVIGLITNTQSELVISEIVDGPQEQDILVLTNRDWEGINANNYNLFRSKSQDDYKQTVRFELDDDGKVPVPKNGVIVGSFPGGQDNGEQAEADTGIKQAVLMRYFYFPQMVVEDSEENANFMAFLQASRNAKQIPMLTIETEGGLESYTDAQVETLAEILKNDGQGVLIRWNHEMNGPWYVWGQQPTLYKQKWIEFVTIIRAQAPQVSFAWCPNQKGQGYPWNGVSSPEVGSADYLNMDTNGDNVVNEDDDPFEPFWPGEAYVDWVGTSIYHWGVDPADPANLGNNVLPQGQYHFGLLFQNSYADLVQYGKPLMVSETGAVYNKDAVGETEEAIKTAFLDELFNLENKTPNTPTLIDDFPELKMIIWFNEEKDEENEGFASDWTFNSNPQVAQHFAQLLQNDYFLKGEDIAGVVDYRMDGDWISVLTPLMKDSEGVRLEGQSITLCHTSVDLDVCDIHSDLIVHNANDAFQLTKLAEGEADRGQVIDQVGDVNGAAWEVGAFGESAQGKTLIRMANIKTGSQDWEESSSTEWEILPGAFLYDYTKNEHCDLISGNCALCSNYQTHTCSGMTVANNKCVCTECRFGYKVFDDVCQNEDEIVPDGCGPVDQTPYKWNKIECGGEPCNVYFTEVSDWPEGKSCKDCGENRENERTVSCQQQFPSVKEAADGMCKNDIFGTKQTCEPLPCKFCAENGHNCLFRGYCDEAKQQCKCRRNYSGRFCEISLSSCPQGIVDNDGTCCVSGMRSDSGKCCKQGEIRDMKGECCSDVVGPCRLCKSDLKSYQFGLYDPCCPHEVDPQGRCCPDVDKLLNGQDNPTQMDACGVCYGDGNCPVQIAFGLEPKGEVTEELQNDIKDFLKVHLAVSGYQVRNMCVGKACVLQGEEAPEQTVGVEGVQVIEQNERRRLREAANAYPRETDVAFTATGFGQNRKLQQAGLQVVATIEQDQCQTKEFKSEEAVEKLQQYVDSNAEEATFKIIEPVRGKAAGNCGNGRCEAGEYNTNCPQDCPSELKACPRLEKYTRVGLHWGYCSANGACNAAAGTCQCFEGYTGDVCNQCADGYVESQIWPQRKAMAEYVCVKPSGYEYVERLSEQYAQDKIDIQQNAISGLLAKSQEARKQENRKTAITIVASVFGVMLLITIFMVIGQNVFNKKTLNDALSKGFDEYGVMR